MAPPLLVAQGWKEPPPSVLDWDLLRHEWRERKVLPMLWLQQNCPNPLDETTLN